MSLIATKTVNVGNAVMRVRGSNGWTTIERRAVMRKLYRTLGTLSADGKRYEVDELTDEKIDVFATLAARSELVSGDLGFEWPTPSGADEKHVTAFGCIGGLRPQDVENWLRALEETDSPPAPELSPQVDEENPT